jgi:integrase
LFERKVQTPKTEAGYRQIDIPISLAKLLKSYVGDRESGLLFPNESGFPLSQTNVNRRSLIPILQKLGVKERGFHAFRRFRITWLRKQRTPEDLISFWCGHAHKTITDTYSKLSDDLEYRLEVAEKVGVGFDVPAPMAPLAPQKEVERAVEVTA